MLSPRLSVNHTLCLHFHFLISRTGMGEYSFLLFLSLISGRAKRLSHELTHVTVVALCSGCSLQRSYVTPCAPVAVCSLSRTQNGAGLSVSVNGKEETHLRLLTSIQFICNGNYSLFMHDKLQYT